MDACINRYHHVNNANRRKRKVMNQSCFHGFARVLEEARTYVPRGNERDCHDEKCLDV